jgi:tRNA pseudouridine38-40 synthase
VQPKPPESPVSLPRRTWLLLLSYDGSRYAGWQVQPSHPTVEAEVEKALERITGQFHKVLGCGRTDAGVHGLNYTAHFESAAPLPAQKWQAALNGLLPQDITVKAVQEMPSHFHARYSALGKRYLYLLHNAPFRNSFATSYSWWIRRPLDLEAMQAAADSLLGTHDFTSFRAARCSAPDPVKTLLVFQIAPAQSVWGNLRIEVEASSFLQHMVRILVGTIVEVGMGTRSVESVQIALARRNRAHAGKTAPAGGLYQLRAIYPEGMVVWDDSAEQHPFA